MSYADNITATSYGFYNTIAGIWGDTLSRIFVVEVSYHKVKQISLSTSLIVTVAGVGTCGFLDNVPATSGKLCYPTGIWADAKGRLFIADQSNHRIRKVENGVITTFAGTGNSGFNGDEHLATATSFYYPEGVIGDSNGNIYVADTANSRIRKIYAVNSTINIVKTIIGSGAKTVSRGSYPATDASLYFPTHVALDTNGNFYISEGQTKARRYGKRFM
jgi:sugar lactone lactonase YvrE